MMAKYGIDGPQVDKFCELIYDEMGMVLDKPRYRDKLRMKVKQRMKKLNFSDCEDYYDFLWFSAEGNKEIKQLVNSCVVNETLFYRYEKQLREIKENIFLKLIQHRRENKYGPLKILSAGCSKGAEPYSLGMAYLDVCKKFGFDIDKPGIEIIGADISTKALKKAESGQYGRRVVENAPEIVVRRYFEDDKDGYQISSKLMDLVNFRYLNIIDSKLPRELDFIFCRNVLIYFDEPVREKVFHNFHKALKDEGFLVLGSSEAIEPYSEYFEPYMNDMQIYQKWTTDRRVDSVWATREDREVLVDKRTPVYKKPLPVVSSEEAAEGKTQKIRISGVAAENIPRDKFKNLIIKKMVPAREKYIFNLHDLKYIANSHLRQMALILRDEINENNVRKIKLVSKDERIKEWFKENIKLPRVRIVKQLSAEEQNLFHKTKYSSAGEEGQKKPNHPGGNVKKESTSENSTLESKTEGETSAVDELLAEADSDSQKEYEISVEEEAGQYVLKLTGKFDSDEIPELTGRLKEEISTLLNLALKEKSEDTKLCIDMNETKFISRNLFKLIDRLKKMAREEPFQVIIECDRKPIKSNLQRWSSL